MLCCVQVAQTDFCCACATSARLPSRQVGGGDCGRVTWCPVTPLHPTDLPTLCHGRCTESGGGTGGTYSVRGRGRHARDLRDRGAGTASVAHRVLQPIQHRVHGSTTTPSLRQCQVGQDIRPSPRCVVDHPQLVYARHVRRYRATRTTCL